MRVVCACVGTFDNLFFSLWMKHYASYNAVGIEQDMVWTKIFGKLCVCEYICQSFFFMNETLCYNAVGIEQNMAWTKIFGKLRVCVWVHLPFFFLYERNIML